MKYFVSVLMISVFLMACSGQPTAVPTTEPTPTPRKDFFESSMEPTQTPRPSIDMSELNNQVNEVSNDETEQIEYLKNRIIELEAELAQIDEVEREVLNTIGGNLAYQQQYPATARRQANEDRLEEEAIILEETVIAKDETISSLKDELRTLKHESRNTINRLESKVEMLDSRIDNLCAELPSSQGETEQEQVMWIEKLIWLGCGPLTNGK